jgi:hypothetical protein
LALLAWAVQSAFFFAGLVEIIFRPICFESFAIVHTFDSKKENKYQVFFYISKENLPGSRNARGLRYR